MATPVGEVGRRVGGRYRLEAAIGEGGMAQVWRATDTTLERAVAVKLLTVRDDATRDAIEQRFLLEARLAAAARHPNVVQVLDFGTDAGRPYMVMEMLDGESLEERLLRPPTLTVGQLTPIMVQTLDGLALVHEIGIIHRDLKPSNVFLARAPGGSISPKLIDFGISRAIDDGPSRRRSPFTTREGFFVGTPEYMSPEQARGLSSIDQRTDIFSIGVMLYEALTGRLPFDSPNVGDLLILIATAEAPSVQSLRPELGHAISDVVARAMQKDPAQRWPSAVAMRDALLDASAATSHPSLPVLAPPPAVTPVPPAVRRAGSSAPTLDDTRPISTSLTPPRSLAPHALARGNRRWMIWAGAVGCFGFLVSGIEIAVLPDEPSAVAAPPRSVPAPEPASAVARPSDPASARPEAPEHVIVRLSHLPPDATVLLDGRPIAGAMPSMPRDGAAHAIEVWVAGSPIWRTVHHASADGLYDVVTQPASAATAVAPRPVGGAPSSAPAIRRGERRPLRPRAPASSTGAAADSFRELDY